MDIHNNVKFALVAGVLLMSSSVLATKRSLDADADQKLNKCIRAEGVAAVPAEAKKVSDDCPICYDSYGDQPESLECGHEFCIKCIYMALREKLTCPLCRKEVSFAYLDTMRFSDRAIKLIKKNDQDRSARELAEAQMRSRLAALELDHELNPNGREQMVFVHIQALAGYDIEQLLPLIIFQIVGPQNLRAAAVAGDLHTVRALVESGINPNDADENGLTALGAATSGGHSAVRDFLLAAIQARAQAGGSGRAPR
jgi:hypothetical protein